MRISYELPQQDVIPEELRLEINPKLHRALYTKRRFIVAYGGRGSGKSWDIARILLNRAMNEWDIIILCLRGTQASIEESTHAVLSAQIALLGLSKHFKITNKEIICIATKSTFKFKGLQHPQRIKSIERVKYAWIEEAAIDVTEEAFIVLKDTVRLKDSKIFISFNPRLDPDYVYQRFVANKDERALVVNLNYYDNVYFPDVLREEMEADKKRSIVLYNHTWLGQLYRPTKGALFTEGMVGRLSVDEMQYLRDNEYAGLERIVIAIDPSGSEANDEKNDMCGIVAVGKFTGEARYCVLEDASGYYSPNGWAKRSLALYDKYNADIIVAEKNFGGEMVGSVIRNARPGIIPKLVNASKGKIVRAEPVSLLYDEGVVFHNGYFTELEFEMFTYTGKKNALIKSPNRFDAMVWGMIELTGKSKVRVPKGMVKVDKGQLVKLKRG